MKAPSAKVVLSLEVLHILVRSGVGTAGGEPVWPGSQPSSEVSQVWGRGLLRALVRRVMMARKRRRDMLIIGVLRWAGD